MAIERENIKLINKVNSDFPAYLDFEKLRSEGIAYLGKLSGKIWTDHNVHDPGITILEVLCYSLLDLGYRTNLPTIDLLSKNPSDTGKDSNFFSAGQILSCNPLSIIDYRKFLIDIEGVRNAWIEVATDQYDTCKPIFNQYNHYNQQNDCQDYLNGLYHVYIDPEKDLKTDFSNEQEGNNYIEVLYNTVKEQLMSHRNFCEDFVDISFLCKLQLGVCASIELDKDADPEKCYTEIIQRLRDFISPSPKFYTLQQLLEKGKSIDEIFAGRPYNQKESHGFIDTDELQEIKLKKEIHLSDLYQIILSVNGVKSVNNLLIRDCNNSFFNSSASWKFKIPKNYVTDFSLECSEFRFNKSGIPLEFDTKRFEGIFNINFSHSGKVLYQNPSSYLDREIPNGNYYEDLDEYYLLQDDFPRVYGIAEGGLPDDVSDHRKAQALQLKGYLLFFDQVLASYLAQLKNLRSLFSMTSSDDPDTQRTYFLNQLTDKPELSKLLRFAVGSDNSNSLGAEGDTLVRIVDKSKLNDLILLNQSVIVDPQILEQYHFSSLIKQEIALNQLIEDFIDNNIESGFLNDNSNNIYYYLLSSSNEFALISKISFLSISAAKLHLNSVTYVGSFQENYRSFIIDENQVSFDLELNISSFKSYLALIIEDQNLFKTRRNSFLNHLLSRFAEKFTDNVLSQFINGNSEQSTDRLLKAKENFLSNYDEISANRGKGYDYLVNNWNNLNNSGFENEAKYLAGIEDKKLHSLCNFVVEQLDDYYVVELSIGKEAFFTLTEHFDSENEAEEAAQMVFNALSQPEKLSTRYIAHDKMYNVVLQYDDRQSVSFFKQYATSQDADAVRTALNRMFSKTPIEEVYISSYSYKVQLVDHAGNTVRNSIDTYDSDLTALESGKKLLTKINDNKVWAIEENQENKISQLYLNSVDPENPTYLDVKAFKLTINNTIVGKPDLFTYELLDSSNSFKFYAAKEFSTNKDAKNHAYLILSLATQPLNYLIDRSSIDSNFKLNIVYENQVEAICNSEFKSEDEAIKMRDQIISTLQKSEYKLRSVAQPNGWKFDYELGYDPESKLRFNSTKEYLYKEDALKASRSFQSTIPSLKVGKSKDGAILTQQNKGSKLPTVKLDSPRENIEDALEKALIEQKSISQYASSNKTQIFKSAIKKEASENSARFVYRLVDKDNVIAVYQDQFAYKEEANLAKMKISKLLKKNIRYLQLCLGGDLFNEITKGNSKSKSYRYQLKAHNLYYRKTGPINEELVLFESTQSYNTKEEALSAFENNYFEILEIAADESNYGSLISYNEIQPSNSSALVFIPLLTQSELESYGEGTVSQLLQRLVKSYPIKRVLGQYYFSTHNSEKNPQQWHSVKPYDTAELAMKEFNFFLMLLKYSGNLFVDCDYDESGKGTFRIYIREVLAESTQRFYNEEAAWGESGVQKFICAIQSDLGLHRFQRKEDCCYSFYLNCGPDILVHPCVYDTAKKRNQVLIDLYDRFKSYIEKESYSFANEKNSLVFKDESGKPFAIKELETSENQDSCDLLFDILDELARDDNQYSFEEGIVFLKNSSGKVILRSYSKDIDLESFKEALILFLCYFPVIRTRDSNNKNHYDIEIKLAGFNSCGETNNQPCGCNDESSAEEEPICHIAWKSSCSFESCSEALRMWVLVNYLLSDYKNYQPVLDCSCNTFGIALNYDLGVFRDSQLSYNGRQIAYNPQCYESSKLLCEAVDRTKDLCNSEGLLAVEHILLRPRCPEDCESRQDLYCLETNQDCGFKWEVDHQDPCSEEEDVCFVSGSDPYSFISTVVLPAWPKRFRSASGRLLMEDILYRLAPAHVMLRILWLAPHDYCCFESKYKNWRRWLAKKKTCISDFSVDEFLDFLFHRNYEELNDCNSCLPCNQETTIYNPCVYRDVNLEDIKPNIFLDQVNSAYCWRVSIPGEYQFVNCNQSNTQYYKAADGIIANRLIADTDTVIKEKVDKPIISDVKSNKRSSPKQFKLLKEKRLLRYRHTVEQVADKLRKNAVILSVQKYMSDPTVVFSQIETLVNQIIENKKTSAKNYVVLNKPQMNRILETVISYALDSLNPKLPNSANLETMNRVFEKLRKSKIDLSSIYNYWDGTELKKYQPKININEIKKLMLGTNK